MSNAPTKKIAIIVGHSPSDSGALGWNGMSEFNYNSFVAEELLKTVKNKELKIFYRDDSGVSGVSRKVNSWQPDVSIELHLNAFNCKVVGCESLYVNANSQELASKFCKDFTNKFNRVLRGAKKIYMSDRGFGNLKNFNHKAILVESFFIDNKEEWVETNDYIKFLTFWMESL